MLGSLAPADSPDAYRLLIIDPGIVNLGVVVLAHTGQIEYARNYSVSRRDDGTFIPVGRLKEAQLLRNVARLFTNDVELAYWAAVCDRILIEHQVSRRMHNVTAALVALYPERSFVVPKHAVNDLCYGYRCRAHPERVATRRHAHNKQETLRVMREVLVARHLVWGDYVPDCLYDHNLADCVLMGTWFLIGNGK